MKGGLRHNVRSSLKAGLLFSQLVHLSLLADCQQLAKAKSPP